MKLFLAITVLLLAFAAQTGAQEEDAVAEKTVEQRLAEFGASVTELSSNLADKTKTAFENIGNSETATGIKNWFTEQFAKVKDGINGMSSK